MGTGASGNVGGTGLAPSISLPKGGGAIRGIGEKFAANPVTGTGSMTVPVAVSPGRSGFGPQLSLAYDSGAGNGPFGFGWSLSLPNITRKTDRGLPRYLDAEESDVFILAGAEDLVPLLFETGGQWQLETLPQRAVGDKTYHVRRYRPRIEGLFARVERWTNVATGESHWRSISRDNVTTIYGRDDNSRICAPADPDSAYPPRIYSWLICQSYDDKGNAIVYEYAAEDDQNVESTQANERNRVRSANRYLKRIKYGNRISHLVQPELTQPDWMFEVVFDYDEGHYETLVPDPDLPPAEQHRLVRATTSKGRPWNVRPDPFSTHRAGFEVRTYRRCHRVLTFHRFAELGDEPYLVCSTNFEYADFDYARPHTIEDQLGHHGSTRFASFISAITQSGYVREETRPVLERDGIRFVTYLEKSLPPLEFEYSRATILDDIRELDGGSLGNWPAGLDGSTYQWVDLDGEGVAGILTEQAHIWFYKPSLGEGRFGPLETIVKKPSLADLGSGRQQFLDLAGDGQLELVALTGPTPGFYERTHDEDWEPFRAFSHLPNIEWDAPNLRFIDLNGDGHADVLITEDEIFTWHPSLAEEGFGPARHIHQPLDEEQGPRLVFADGTQSVYVADMCGDGLNDLVRILNGEVCYWPNLGYGRFGAKVTMDNAPWFDSPDQFSQQRVRLADLDGSGLNDIIYLGREGVRLYFNESGNRWSAPRRLRQFPHVDNLSSVMTVDLLGNGTACLVWSSPLPGDVRRPICYIDLMGGQKPGLLVKVSNNLGAETHVHYISSTRFYLADKAAGTPWVTKLPFPVHVVERVENYDRIGRNRFVTRYSYHHGYFDGVEREFRGFGLVEQWDTEVLAGLNAAGELPTGDNIDAASHVPPVHTKTWFHTGVYLSRDHISDFFAGLSNTPTGSGYYREPGLSDDEARALLLDDTVLPTGLTLEEEREACRALKGAMLRQEVYAEDGTDRADHPYVVTEQNFTVKVLQARGDNRHAVFYTHDREAVSYHYERNPADPRITHALTLKADSFGNVLKSASVCYGRRMDESRTPDAALATRDQLRQSERLITYTENDFTNHVGDPDDYRVPLPYEARTYELTGLLPPGDGDRFTLAEILNAGTNAAAIDYEESTAVVGLQKRLIEHARALYRRDDLTSSLPLGQLQALALPFESYNLAFTPGLLNEVYGGLVSDTMLANDGGYVHSQDASGEEGGGWWIPSGRVFYSPGGGDAAAQELAYARRHFFLPHRHRDPFHTGTVSTESFVSYDAYDLLTLETLDALGNRITVGERDNDGLTTQGNDYRVLQPSLITDANGNRSAVAFDVLGLVVGTAVMGKPPPAPAEGDSLDGFEADLTEAALLDHLSDPLADPQAILRRATSRLVYDLFAYQRTKADADPQPACVYTLTRETHDSDPLPASGLKTQHSFSYSDGFGREIQKKIQAEPGPVLQRGDDGKIIVGAQGRPEMTPNDVVPRWVGSGWTLFNNKGKPVRQYESFFTDTPRFEFDVRVGVSPVLFYDPVARVVATLHPDHTWEKVVFDSWRQESWDANDTVLIADPRTDADVGDFFRRLPVADYLPTWYVRRAGGTLGTEEKAAAVQTAVHAATPTVAHFDPLGRTFLTVAHNRFKYTDAPPNNPPIEAPQSTRVVLDIEGNPRELLDAEDRVVMRYGYRIAGPEEGDKQDGAGNRIHQTSMEAGARWTLNDVAGHPLYAWDSRGQRFRTAYDPLRRPTDFFLLEGTGAERLVGRTVYGETRPNPEANNLRGKAVSLFDQAGVVNSDAYDFKGNLLRSRRQLAADYKATLDWSAVVPLEATTYTSATLYDALNRPLELTAPDGSIVRPGYNEANLLERIEVTLQGETVATPFVTDIDYDAKGQRTLIDYGNGVRTTYTYDPLTLRLVRLFTRRDSSAFPDDCPQPHPDGWPGCQLQNLHYTYDPVGNITHIGDDAQQTVYFRNRRVEPNAVYNYDSLYRLIEANGREHLGQVGGQSGSPTPPDALNGFHARLSHPSDGHAMGTYAERYVYDSVGNILSMQHRGSDPSQPGWTRTYAYNEASQLEPGKVNNRLSSTTIGATNETYQYDGAAGLHGNITAMPHLPLMLWDYRDQLRATARQVVNNGTPETTWYVYDSGGQRVRKVTERQAAAGQTPTRMKERIYLGGFELYREYENDGDTLKLERATLHVMDDKQRIALVETRIEGNDPAPARLIRYQLGSHLGSASLELDKQAQIISYEEYYPYGSTSYQAVRSQTETPKRYRYTGKEQDEETGLAYHGARYYAAWLGRWTSCDPTYFTDGSNLYQYVNSNATRYRDLGGTQKEECGVEEHREPTKSFKRLDTWKKEDNQFFGHVEVTAETTLSTLAELVTGNASDAAVLKDKYSDDDELLPGQIIDVSPLLQVLEHRLKSNILSATENIYAEYPASGQPFFSNRANQTLFYPEQIESFFDSNVNPAPISDCLGAAYLILAKGLIDTIGSDNFEALYTSRTLPLVYKNVGINELEVGDWGYFKNNEHYLEEHPGGGYMGENFIKVGEDNYYGFPVGANTEKGWNNALLKEYNNGLPENRRIDPTDVPGYLPNETARFDVAAIAMSMFARKR